MLVIRTDNRFDYVDDSVLDNLINSKEIVKFKRNAAWVNVGADPMRTSKREMALKSNDRLAINDSIFVREYRRIKF